MSVPDRIDNTPPAVGPLQPQAPQRPTQPARTPDGKTFADLLRTKVGDKASATTEPEVQIGVPTTVKWSAHAAARLQQRGIELGDAQLERLERAVDKAAAKGSRDALVMMDDIAMVVSVKNKTVITALAQAQAKENVFTNIDSAVIA